MKQSKSRSRDSSSEEDLRDTSTVPNRRNLPQPPPAPKHGPSAAAMANATQLLEDDEDDDLEPLLRGGGGRKGYHNLETFQKQQLRQKVRTSEVILNLSICTQSHFPKSEAISI